MLTQMKNRSAWIFLTITVVAIVLLALLGPAEKALGSNVRVVYLHGAWVWTALSAYLLAALAGLAGLILRKPVFHCWSMALGRTGLLFWLTYLPLSLWAMQTNWNGLFLAEPRWRLALIFSVVGVLLQAGLALLARPVWTSVGNIAFAGALLVALRSIPNVMHPASPIFSSDAMRIQFYFLLLVVMVLLAALQVAYIQVSKC
jgi:hypothetical protein